MRKLSHPVCVFDRFTFDPTRGCLLCGQEEIKLRPKSFEVLKYLIENNGRLISKDELIQSVWVDTASQEHNSRPDPQGGAGPVSKRWL